LNQGSGTVTGVPISESHPAHQLKLLFARTIAEHLDNTSKDSKSDTPNGGFNVYVS
jgi:hypothetical protein